MKAKKQNNKIPVIMAEVSSLRDLVRLGSTFTPQLSYLYGMKAGKGNILFLKGEKIGDSMTVYFCTVDGIKPYLLYGPHSANKEELLMVNDITKYAEDYKMYKAQVVELLDNPFSEGKKQKVLLLKTADYRPLVKRGVRVGGGERPGKVYSFVYKGKEYVGLFDFFHDENVTTFLYAEAKGCHGKGFFRYNYTTDTLAVADCFSDSQYPCVRIINLAAPFSFFKPE